MKRQICHIWAVLLILSLSINIRGESTISSPTDVKDATEKSIETTTSLPESSTTVTTTENISSSKPTITISDSTTVADVLSSEPTTKISSPTTTIPETTTTTTTTISNPTTTIPETTTISIPTTTTISSPTTTILETTTTISETTIATSVPESTTIVNVSESTTSIPDLTTIGSIDNATIEISTTQAIETTTAESLKFDSTVETTTVLEKPSMDIESQDVKNFYPHLGKPKWAQMESSKSRFLQNDANSSTNELIQEIIPLLAEYINNQTDDDITNLVIDKLKDKLDQSELNINDDDRKALRGTVKLILKNLPVIVQTIVSNIGKVNDENCPVKFTFYNNVYCIKFELNFESSFAPKILPPIKSTVHSPTNISIESFKVFNTDHIDKPPTTWQQWLSPPPFHDQTSSTTNEPTVVCYYTNWAQYRNGPGRFYPENIDINLCTHINYAFAQLTDGVIAPYEWNDESTPWSTGMFARLMNLRKGPRPKILLAIGGWNHGSGRFSDMVRNDTKRATFITTTIIFLQKHKFDGLDLDWEYPGSRDGSRPTDKSDFVKLITELKAAFLPYSLLLTAAVGAGKPTIDAGYDIPKVCQQLDFINLMAYDLHGSWETETGLHTALYGHQNDTAINKQLTVDWAVRYWIKGGCPPSKIVLGLALYGRTFRLASSLNTKVGAPAVGPGSAGLYTGEAGFLGYYEICTRVQQQGWTKVFDDEQKANYAYKGVEWVGYEDAYSLGFKIAYVKDMGLGGIMFWAPDLDDFTGGSCNEGKYPLMNAAINLFRGQTEWITTTKPPPTTSSPTTTIQSTLPEQKRIVCYYTNWAQYRPDGGKFVPENFDASLCTHIIYAFAVLKDSKLTAFEWNDEDTDWSKGMYSRLMQLKKTNVNPKVLLAVGGWNFGSGPFSDMVADKNLRSQFVQQATQFIRDHQFDGLDLDWEYPGGREGSRPQDKQLFTTLVKELNAAFEPYNLLLTAAVGAGASTIKNGYEIDKIAPYLDFINLMTYDLHGGGWENFTGLHTALYARPEEDEIQITLNQNWAVNYWIQQGMPKEKISMGLATYGRTYTLANNSNTEIGAPSSGPGQPGKYTRESGFLSYYEICEKLNSGLWTSKYDDVQKSMYAYGEDMWVGYDNIDTMTIRANYIIGKDLGGVMIWAPDLDDFSGKFCNQGPYPLVKTIVNLIQTGIIVPIDMPTVPTSTATIQTTVTPTITTTTSTATTTITTTTTTTTTTTITTTTKSSPFLLSPPPNATIPSVVCMTIINPLVFQTIDVKLCSHLILVPTVTDTDIFQSTLSSDTLQQLKAMKTINSKLQIFYSILGRWKPAHLNLIGNDQSRQDFNQKIKQYLIDNNLDGFDIDWSIQANQISALTDKYLLSTWLSELRNAFAPNQLSLSIGIGADKTVLDNSYDFNKISSTVDFIRLMAFDWPSSNVTAFLNPLFPVDVDPTDNIKWAINYLIALGVPPEQISLGIPTHGRWFGLADGNQNTVGSPIIGSAMPVAYSDICKLLKNTNYVQKYNQPSRSSYAYNIQRKQWISFDTVNDVALIARFAKLEEIGGVTLSAVGMDDIDGQCGNGPYPLLHAASAAWNNNPTDSSLPRNVVSNPPNQWKQKSVFCSVSSTADEYSGLTQFTLDKVNPYLCTHLLISSHSSLLTPSISDQLKNANPNLKILLTFNADEDGTIEQWKEELKKKKTDGINIYINANAFSSQTADLIKSIQPALTDGQLFTISFQLPSDPAQQMSFFHVLELHKFVDYVLVLPFDGKSIAKFKQIQPWNSLATFVAANPDKNIGDFSMMSTLLFTISTGVPSEKLVLGIATYGLSFLLENEDHYLIGDKISGQGLPGHITNTTGILASYEICERIESDGYDRFLSNESIVVVAHKKQDFITFDDTQPLQLSERFILNGTVELKATFIKNAQIAGVLVHAIDMDDYTGSSCHRGPFPITTVVSRVFSTSMPFLRPPPPPPPSPSSFPSSKNMAGVKNVNPCAGVKTKDLIADENDCQYYYVCMPQHHEPVAHLQCPNNMHFSPQQKACSQQEFEFPCSSKSKFNTIHRSAPSSEISLPKVETPFVCPTSNGIFPDSSDCTQFFACSNNLVIPMKCPLKTKFNPQSNRCDWTSSSCP